jgi:hypothetical protein
MAKNVKHRLADDIRASLHEAIDYAAGHRLSEDERKGIERGLTAMREGRFAGDEPVAAILKKARSSRP